MMNDIDIAFRKILRDWDGERNGLVPADLKPRDKRSVWWLCELGHSYKVSVHSRLRSGGCKKCNLDKIGDRVRSGRLASGKSKSLSEVASEEILCQWSEHLNDPLTLSEITSGSKKLVWWTCEKGHGDWQASPKSRIKGSQCPICVKKERKRKGALKRIEKSGGSLLDFYPELCSQWDFDKNKLNPDEYTYASNQSVYWVCKFGHKWSAKINNRTLRNSGCPFCSSQTSEIELFILCELRYLFEDVRWRIKFEGKEIDIFIDDISTGIEIDGGYWHRDKYEKDLEKNRLFNSAGMCLYRIRHNSLKTINPSVSYSDSDDKLFIFHKLLRLINKKYNFDFVNRYIDNGVTQNQEQFRKMLSALPAPVDGNDLESTHPNLLSEWDETENSPLKPHMFSPNSGYRARWICNSGHRWEAQIKNRTQRSSGCPTCNDEERSHRAFDRYIAKFGSVYNDKSGIIARWDYQKNGSIDPKKISTRHSKSVHWLCASSGHSFTRSPRAMIQNTSCPICLSLPVKFPELLLEYDISHPENPDPYTIASRSDKSVWWKCRNDHSFRMRVAARTHKKSPGQCPACLSLGFKYPELLNEFETGHPENPDPFLVRAHSSKLAKWVCPMGHHYSMRISDRTRKNPSGCPDCAKSKRSKVLSAVGKARSHRKKSIF